MPENPIERIKKLDESIKKLDEERATVLAEAKKSALTKAKEGVADLVALGFPYELVEANGARKPNKAKKGLVGDKQCPVCKFKTKPPHDARVHRGQGKKKKPFTPQQLQELGYAKA